MIKEKEALLALEYIDVILNEFKNNSWSSEARTQAAYVLKKTIPVLDLFLTGEMDARGDHDFAHIIRVLTGGSWQILLSDRQTRLSIQIPGEQEDRTFFLEKPQKGSENPEVLQKWKELDKKYKKI